MTHIINAIFIILIRAQAAANLKALNEKNEVLQESYTGRNGLDHSFTSMNSVSEYDAKYVKWPLPDRIEHFNPKDSIGTRWGGDNEVYEESMSQSMLRDAVTHITNENDGYVAGCHSTEVNETPHNFAWHPRNEFAEIAPHGTFAVYELPID